MNILCDLNYFQECILLIIYHQKNISLDELEEMVIDKNLLLEIVYLLKDLGLVYRTYKNKKHRFSITSKGICLCVRKLLITKIESVPAELLHIEDIRIPVHVIPESCFNELILDRVRGGLKEIFIDRRNLEFLHSNDVRTLADLQRETISGLFKFSCNPRTRGQLGRLGVSRLIAILKFYGREFADGDWSV